MSNIKSILEKYKDRSAEFKISVVSGVCSKCVHFDRANAVARQCSAFPNGIPLPIWNGENDHTKQYPGDNGIRFASILEKRAA